MELQNLCIVKDIVHINAILSFTAVSLEVKLAKFLFLVWYDELMFKLALFPLYGGKYI